MWVVMGWGLQSKHGFGLQIHYNPFKPTQLQPSKHSLKWLEYFHSGTKPILIEVPNFLCNLVQITVHFMPPCILFKIVFHYMLCTTIMVVFLWCPLLSGTFFLLTGGWLVTCILCFILVKSMESGEMVFIYTPTLALTIQRQY